MKTFKQHFPSATSSGLTTAQRIARCAEGCPYFDFIGVAAPTEQATFAIRGAHAYECSERFALGAFGDFDGGTTAIRMNHAADREIANGEPDVHLKSMPVGLVVAFRVRDREHASALRARLRDGGVTGLSITYLRDHAQSVLSARSGQRTIRRLQAGGLKEISLCTEAEPAYAGSWLMEAGPAALVRLITENIEVEEKFHGDAFLPGRSGAIKSRTQYRFNLKRRSA